MAVASALLWLRSTKQRDYLWRRVKKLEDNQEKMDEVVDQWIETATGGKR
jgi:hypothetical protein